jgi:hypothetical protein
MAFQMNVSGIFRGDLLYIKRIYSITAFNLVTSRQLGSENHNCVETRQRLRISPKLSSDQPLVHYGLILRTVQKHYEKINFPNTSQCGFLADHSTALQCMKLEDHVILNFNNSMSMAAVFLDID